MLGRVPDVRLASWAGSSPNGDPEWIPCASRAVRALERIAVKVATSDVPLLLLGEPGSGKRVLAWQIHRLSDRRNRPFTAADCAALSPDFFRWDQHTGGNGSGTDLFGGGTLFLYEVCELSKTAQTRLLEFLTEVEQRPDGALGPRLIAASRRSLEPGVAEGRFREDLCYWLSGTCLNLPPLRHRREDIPVLAEYFLEKYCDLFGRPHKALSPETEQLLKQHNWPGNVRELESAIQTIAALGDERAALQVLNNLEEKVKTHRQRPLSLKQAARAASRLAERELILQVLTRTRWNRKRAAQELQISYKAFLYKLKQIGMDDGRTPQLEGEN